MGIGTGSDGWTDRLADSQTDRQIVATSGEEGARWTAKSPLMSLIKKEGMKEGREGAAAS